MAEIMQSRPADDNDGGFGILRLMTIISNCQDSLTHQGRRESENKFGFVSYKYKFFFAIIMIKMKSEILYGYMEISYFNYNLFRPQATQI